MAMEETSDNKGVETGEKTNARSWFSPRRLPSNHYLLAVGAFTLFGVIGGYAYYALVGCKTGGCAITSSPVMSIIWGGLLGYLLPDYFFKPKE